MFPFDPLSSFPAGFIRQRVLRLLILRIRNQKWVVVVLVEWTGRIPAHSLRKGDQEIRRAAIDALWHNNFCIVAGRCGCRGSGFSPNRMDAHIHTFTSRGEGF